MIQKIKVILGALMLIIILLTWGGCATSPSGGSEKPGAARGTWSHFTPGP